MTDFEKEQKLRDILGNSALIESMAAAGSNEEVQKLFAENGLDLSLDEVRCFIAVMDGGLSDEIDEQSLDLVAGGSGVMFVVYKAAQAAKYLYLSAKGAWETGRTLARYK